MFVICGRCILAIRSRGETIFVGEPVHDEAFTACMWCEEPSDELYAVEFEKTHNGGDMERDDEFDEENDNEI